MDKVQKHVEICKVLTDTYKRKNADYGDSFSTTFHEYGMITSVLRLDDKFKRFKQLALSGNPQVKEESIEDTLLDLANYAIMTIIEIRNSEKKIVDKL